MSHQRRQGGTSYPKWGSQCHQETQKWGYCSWWDPCRDFKGRWTNIHHLLLKIRKREYHPQRSGLGTRLNMEHTEALCSCQQCGNSLLVSLLIICYHCLNSPNHNVAFPNLEQQLIFTANRQIFTPKRQEKYCCVCDVQAVWSILSRYGCQDKYIHELMLLRDTTSATAIVVLNLSHLS